MKVAIRHDEVDITQLLLKPEDEEALRQCIRMSAECWTGLVNGEVICTWGVVPPTLMSNQAYLWLYTTERVKDHQFVLVRHSQREIEKLLQKYDSIIGCCATDAKQSRRWLEWLGATFGFSDGKFIAFEIRKK